MGRVVVPPHGDDLWLEGGGGGRGGAETREIKNFLRQ